MNDVPYLSAAPPAGKPFRLSAYAFLISFTGSLPVGTLNVGVTDLVINGDVGGAILFGLGAILIEVSMVRIALVTVKRLAGMTHLVKWFRVLAGIVILLVAFISLEAAWHMRKAAMVVPFAGHAPFVSGLVLSLLNPLHLPFWMGWTAVLKAKGLLSDTRGDYNAYVIAIGAGTSFAFMVYGTAGHLLIYSLRANQNIFNWLVGIALLGTGLFQMQKALKACRRDEKVR
ncbi:LysE family transporter [Flavitalea sp. BT771]|uniref:LysE family transporter n=1 Tax=Flavitalea sp. BT771 TaxID=3063329 RepID=UPI0026E236F8|nr:LysE family transporter [Flavitalea sp. BT771]MDO6431140.1 LysE family transporter [Flavitalea sp. BT771]MDV6220047.1 LysE family transporter [Flavitalea sp. BT771]